METGHHPPVLQVHSHTKCIDQRIRYTFYPECRQIWDS
ncbi:hypothetical protein C7S15_3123 [Burkholderia cepacia]|nr:hypothetical protein [Burkholderia cepacia]